MTRNRKILAAALLFLASCGRAGATLSPTTDETSTAPSEPVTTTTYPAPAALCVDGAYSFSETDSETCSFHGGVAQWLNGHSPPPSVATTTEAPTTTQVEVPVATQTTSSTPETQPTSQVPATCEELLATGDWTAEQREWISRGWMSCDGGYQQAADQPATRREARQIATEVVEEKMVTTTTEPAPPAPEPQVKPSPPRDTTTTTVFCGGNVAVDSHGQAYCPADGTTKS